MARGFMAWTGGDRGWVRGGGLIGGRVYNRLYLIQ